MLDIQRLLPPFNPWWDDLDRAFDGLPEFRRPIFDYLKSDLESLPQIISITGPRRVGKTTLLQQLVRNLIEQGVNPRRIVYYSMDDPALLLNSAEEINGFIEDAMRMTRESSDRFYFFLDEIQRLEGWELYLKKYYDLKYPVRFVISGSASSPIFRKSRESLLGRVKDYHLLPFSFREFMLYRLGSAGPLIAELRELGEIASAVIQSIIDPQPASGPITIKLPSEELRMQLDSLLATYFHEGGFPEVWSLPTLVAKQDYLFDNQVRKVIDEDLVLAVDLRKPELLKKFYLSLLATPGAEKNMSEISAETGINTQQIEKYLPLLEMTDLLFHVSKFRSGSLSIRKGNVKFYLSDLALRNAVLRISPESLMADDDTLGRYAENLVFLALKKWRGSLQIDYYRERDEEIDFITHAGAGRFLPIEVKYRNVISDDDGDLLRKFKLKYPKSSQPILVTKTWNQFAYPSTGNRLTRDVFHWPLPLFLIMFG